jgi:hypothetical protein
MPYYEITNTSGGAHNTVSLSLGAGLTTVVNFNPSLPAAAPDLNAAILSGVLVVKRLGLDGSSGSGDPITNVIETTIPALTTSQEIMVAQASRLPPGIEITNETSGDIAIRASASSSPAGWANGSHDGDLIAPGQTVTIAADYIGAVQAICEFAVGSIRVKVFH